MLDPEEPAAEVLIERARAAEEAALAVNGVTNSEGAEAGWGRSSIALAASNGFAGFYSGSSHGVSASVIAGSGTAMERHYDFSSAIYAADLRHPTEGRESSGSPRAQVLSAFISGSAHGVSPSVIAGSGTAMERDYDFSSAIYAADLRDPTEVGKSAGERAVKRLGAKKMPTCRCPVVFDPRV